MERILLDTNGGFDAAKAVSYEKAAAEFNQEAENAEELSCNQLLKNLLKTNLTLRKLNELSSMLLF